jgi:C4-dicarboxylate transporter DctM subunit
VSLSLKDVFLGGAIPGTLLVLMTIGWGMWKQPKFEGERSPLDWNEIGKAFVGALGELLLPVLTLFALFSGYATPIEAASVSAFYAFLLYLVDARWVRKANIRAELPQMVSECGLLVGGVLLILGVAMGLTDYLIFAMIPDQMVEWAQATIESKYVFLLALNGTLILVGCLMDIFSAIIVIVPLIVPLGVVFGIHPVHLGIIFLANLQLGYLTPPIGMNLFLASYRFGKPMSVVIRASLPLLVVFAIGVLLITYVPILTTWLPDLFQ